MKSRISVFIFMILAVSLIYSCGKEEYFKSEKGIKKELQGNWKLIPIPKNDTIWNPAHTSYVLSEHFEDWTFNDTKVDIVNNNLTGSSTYTVKTSFSKAELKLEGVSQPLSSFRYDGTWQIVTLDDEFLIIANDKDGSTGLFQLEFKKQ
jgi:hypothetical protein